MVDPDSLHQVTVSGSTRINQRINHPDQHPDQHPVQDQNRTVNMSDESYAAALHIRSTIDRKMETIPEDMLNIQSWFATPHNSNVSLVPYQAMAGFADKELEDWYKLPENLCSYTCDYERKLKEWVQEQTDLQLSEIIEKTPRGSGGIVFTPWQRLFMAFICYRPFNMTSTIEISTEQLHSLRNPNDNSRKRKLPFFAEWSSLKGTCLSINILKLATAGGKTSTSLSIGWMLATNHYTTTTTNYYNSQKFGVFRGNCNAKIPRLIVVAAPGGVHAHWVNEFERLKSEFNRMSPEFEVVLWKGQSKHYSTKIASEYGDNKVIFWIISMANLNEEMRKCPSIPILCVVTDEMTIDTPREKTETAQSPVVCRLLPQATPSALCDATSGCTSWLRREMEGELIGPHRMESRIKYGDHKALQLLINQRCKLDNMMPGFFRDQIRMDLCDLIPVGMQVIHVQSKRGTLASHISQTLDDLVPASFKNVLLSKLPSYRVNYNDGKITELGALLDIPSVPLEQVTTLLKSIKCYHPPTDLAIDKMPDLKRIVDRIEEFSNECPICCEETSNIQMLNCCSYCICTSCLGGCNRCPFCRKPKDEAVILVESNAVPEVTIQEELHDSISTNTNRNNIQMKNMINSINTLKTHTYKRIIIMINFGYSAHLSISTITSYMKRKTGIQDIVYAEYLTGGAGTKFARVKERFDDLEKNPEPMILICNNHDSSAVLVGTNFDKADSVIVVGNIAERIGTQLMGRIFRPNLQRDNTKHIPFVKIYSPIR